MKLEEVLPALRNGKKIYNSHDSRQWVNNDPKTHRISGYIHIYGLLDDWEIEDEDKKTL